jgi:hypothetical protein
MLILFAVCMPMNVLRTVVMLVQMRMFELQAPLVVNADFPPSAIGDPKPERAQRECRGDRNEVSILHRK